MTVSSKVAGKRHASGCPVAYGLNAFGDRWTLLIVRGLMLRGSTTFGELLDADEGISSNILTDRLKQLETEGLIGRAPSPENRRSNIYYMTEKGAELAPVLLEIIRWSARYDPQTITRPSVRKRIEKDFNGFVSELIAKQRHLRASLGVE